jgi:hypothetical protein
LTELITTFFSVPIFILKFSTNTNNVFNTISANGFWILGGVLPVELISFNANVKNSSVKLNWETSSELNNTGFEIERKTANQYWTKIGFVQGNGTTNTQHTYFYNDRLNNTGTYSYRLKQIDNNGNFKYHNLKFRSCNWRTEKFCIKAKLSESV